MAADFAKEILPSFRSGDITCMASKGIRLGDAQWMCDLPGNHGFYDHGNARRVYSALSAGFMPPGKKWSHHQLKISSTWITDGFQPRAQRRPAIQRAIEGSSCVCLADFMPPTFSHNIKF
jgi:hypothetical protein